MPVLPLWLLNLARNKWAQRAALALGVVVLLLGARAHYIHEGRRQGSETAHAEATQQQAAKSEEHRAADRTTADRDHRRSSRCSSRTLTSAKRSHAGRQQVLLALGGTFSSSRPHAQVAGMTPVQVQQLDQRALGRPKDSTAPYSDRAPAAKIASCFEQLPLCNQQVNAAQQARRPTRYGQRSELSGSEVRSAGGLHRRARA
jgi:hypothetical protein